MEALQETSSKALRFLQGGGEMGELIRSYDWSTTSLGSPEQWPQSLLTTLGLLLHSSFPGFLYWGEELLCFYNDAFRPSLGSEGKHPALAKKGEEVWPEIWQVIAPLINKVMTTAEPVWFEDQLIPIYRNGKMEDVYWTFSYGPAYDDNGNVNGVFVTCTETTKNVRSNQTLKQSEQNLRNTILKAPVAMCILKGPDHVVEIANERMIELWGTTAHKVLGKSIFDGLPEVRNQGYEELLDSVYTTGKAFAAQASPVTLPREGRVELVYVNFLYEAYREPDGTISGVIAVAIDVTNQEISRRKVEESEHRVRSIVESAPFPIGVYVGKEMRIELANQSIIDVWGKGPGVIGKTYSEVLPELENQQIYEQLDQVFTTGKPFHARNQRVDLVVDGKLQPYYFNYSFTPLFDSDGKIYGVMNTAAEITDLVVAKQRVEQSERNFRNLIKQAPVAMCLMLGPQHVIEMANKLMMELWDRREADVIGKPVFEAVPDAKDQGLEALLDQVYSTGESFYANEMPVVLLRNGRPETTYQNFVYDAYKNADGTVLGVIAITVEVTQQVLARQRIEEVVAERTKELATANNHLQQSNAALQQFAYIASHDLQEPVRKVSTFTQMLEAHLGAVDDRARNYIEKIKTSSSRMLSLIRDVLAYSELSKADQSFEAVDLHRVIEDAKIDFELLIAEKKAQITTGNLPVIQAIPLHISQLFANLISNALKFTRAGVTPEISITSSVLSPEEKKEHPSLSHAATCYKIEVKDNGIGFDQEHAGQIFNIFQRLHGKKQYEGTGIGLAMCQRIVQNHHGEIYARSEPGKGSCFVILLPEKQEIL